MIARFVKRVDENWVGEASLYEVTPPYVDEEGGKHERLVVSVIYNKGMSRHETCVFGHVDENGLAIPSAYMGGAWPVGGEYAGQDVVKALKSLGVEEVL